jgi:enterochelin esterase family protein
MHQITAGGLSLMTRMAICFGTVFMLLALPLAAEETLWRTNVASPRIDTLAAQLRQGDTVAVAKFWTEVSATHAPLIESISDDPAHLLVTFVYGGGASTKSVIVDSQLIEGRDVNENRMTRLGGTDLWYKTYWLRKDFRISYGFIVDGGEVSADPLNPHSAPNAPHTGPSALALPDAPPEPWITPKSAVPAGKLQEDKIESKVLASTRQIWIYTPPGFDAKRTESYPLMICFDGLGYASADYVPATTTVDNLLAAGKIPPVLLVLIGQSPQPGRNLELTNNPQFLDYVANEVVPYVRLKWHATSDPARTIVCGSSTGGLSSAYFAFRRPDVFGNVLSQSGAFWPGKTREDPGREWLTDQFDKSPKLPIRFVMQVGLLERHPTPQNGPSILDTNRRLHAVLAKKKYDVHYSEIAGGHEPISWRGGLADGITELLGAGRPVAAVDGIVAAFQKRSVVIIGEWTHGIRQVGDFLVQLVRDPSFQRVAPDIVIEFVSRNNQPLLDRYVAGENIPIDQVRHLWRDTTKVASWESPMYAEWLAAIRDVNRTLPPERRLRVLAGDTAIDWTHIQTHDQWAALGDNNLSFVAVVDDVLKQNHRALMVLGGNHVTKLGSRTGAPNVTTLVERRHPGSTWVVIHHLVPSDPIEADLRLPNPEAPALYEVAGTPFGETPDANGVAPARYTDAWLYLGPAASMKKSEPPPASLEASYMREVDRRSLIEWGELRARAFVGAAAAQP